MNKRATHRRAMNGPVRAIAGNKSEQRIAAARGLFAVNHREAARLASAVGLSDDRRRNATEAVPYRPKISLYSLRPADAGTGSIPGVSSD